jgi:hypothetical protein
MKQRQECPVCHRMTIKVLESLNATHYIHERRPHDSGMLYTYDACLHWKRTDKTSLIRNGRSVLNPENPQ